MKFDYKPRAVPLGPPIFCKSKATLMGSPMLRRTLHVGFGFTAFFCLALAVSLDKSSAPTITPTTISAEAKVESASTAEQSTKLITTKVEPPLKKEAKVASAIQPKPIASVAATSQIESLEEEIEENWQIVKIRAGDTLSKIFNRLGIATKDIHEIMTADPASRRLASLHPQQTLKLRITKDQQLAGLILDIAPGSALHVWKMEEGFQVEHKLLPLEKQLAFGKGAIQDSLFLAGKRAGLDHNILAQMVEIFGWNIDFALDLQPNDTFRVLYEEKCLDGERIQTGHILAAEIVNDGKKHQAIRYTDKTGYTSYFSPDGYGMMHQAFLRAPVNFARVSSHFGTRKHPILHKIRQHKGVDYSAPHGTPVQATGDGKVVFVGTRGGFGKVVELQHGARYSTLYAHLSRFPKGMRAGLEVKQGQIIGFVGRTGLATGDHLHYEFRIDGIHRDPLTVSLPKKKPITETNKRHFLAHAKEMLKLLDIHEHKINMAHSEYPIPTAHSE